MGGCLVGTQGRPPECLPGQALDGTFVSLSPGVGQKKPGLVCIFLSFFRIGKMIVNNCPDKFAQVAIKINGQEAKHRH